MFGKIKKNKKQHYIRTIELTEYITLVIFGYKLDDKDNNTACLLEFKNGEIYPIIV